MTNDNNAKTEEPEDMRIKRMSLEYHIRLCEETLARGIHPVYNRKHTEEDKLLIFSTLQGLRQELEGARRG